jgi:hypothetical protein
MTSDTNVTALLPPHSLMRLMDVAICAAAHERHAKRALKIAEALSKVLVGPRMDFVVGSIMWMAGEQQAAAEVLEAVASDPELGVSAQSMLAMLLATEGNSEWKRWSANAEEGGLDSLHRRMLATAHEIAAPADSKDASGASVKAAPAQEPRQQTLPPIHGAWA